MTCHRCTIVVDSIQVCVEVLEASPHRSSTVTGVAASACTTRETTEVVIEVADTITVVEVTTTAEGISAIDMEVVDETMVVIEMEASAILARGT